MYLLRVVAVLPRQAHTKTDSQGNNNHKYDQAYTGESKEASSPWWAMVPSQLAELLAIRAFHVRILSVWGWISTGM
jgi:hypothetical protein